MLFCFIEPQTQRKSIKYFIITTKQRIVIGDKKKNTKFFIAM